MYKIKDFDYDLWKDTDGKCYARVRSTGEICQISNDNLKQLLLVSVRHREQLCILCAFIVIKFCIYLIMLNIINFNPKTCKFLSVRKSKRDIRAFGELAVKQEADTSVVYDMERKSIKNAVAFDNSNRKTVLMQLRFSKV